MTNQEAAETLRLLKLFVNQQNHESHITPAIDLGAEALELLESIGNLEYVEIWRDPTESLVRISGTVYRGTGLLDALREARKAQS